GRDRGAEQRHRESRHRRHSAPRRPARGANRILDRRARESRRSAGRARHHALPRLSADRRSAAGRRANAHSGGHRRPEHRDRRRQRRQERGRDLRSGERGLDVTPALGKDLLGLEPLSGEQIKLILDTAEPFKEISLRAIKKVPTLRGATIVNLFFEASTRTRISFEFAEKRLSADNVNVASTGSSVSKGETLVDTARNLEAMRIDMVVIRHGASGAAQFLAERIESN